MSLVRPGLIALAAFALATPAFAEDPAAADAPVATAKGAPAAPPQDTTAADIKSFIADGADQSKEPLPDHKQHGFVSVGVGTRGYREISGAVEAPVGDHTQVDIAIDAGHVDGRRR